VLTIKTTEEIYSGMCADYTAKTGRTLSRGCDMSVRLMAAAAQISSLYIYNDWVLAQSFPQTASGSFLDMHAQMRGITRNSASHATGTLRFGVTQPAAREIPVAAGTVCMTVSGVAFETTEEGAIAGGATYCDVSARAVEGGSSGNASEGSVVLMGVAPVGVEYCTNPSGFTGGAEAEDDESLRARVVASYTQLPNGANAAWYEKTVSDMDGVAAVRVIPKRRGLGTVDIIISGVSGAPSQELLDGIKDVLDEARELCVDIEVMAPETVSVAVSCAIDVDDAHDPETVRTAVASAIGGYFTGERLGEDVLLAKLGDIIYGVPGVVNYRITQPASDVSVDDDKLPVAGGVTVSAWS